jgi:class 3 adenylate cyclase
MGNLLPKSIQSRLALLIGALTLTAAFTIVIGIVNAADFLQQLAEVQRTSATLREYGEARKTLSELNASYKNVLIGALRAEEFRAYEYGLLYRYYEKTLDFIYAREFSGEDVSALQDLFDDLGVQIDDSLNLLFELEESDDASDIIVDSMDAFDELVVALDFEIAMLYERDFAELQVLASGIEANLRMIMLVGQVAFVILAILLIWAVYEMMNISRPLENLTGAVVAFENKTYEPRMLEEDARRPDELGELSRSVSAMATSITESNRMKEQFLRAAQRFIPSQYLEFLEKDSITKVHLGDHVSAEMAVMFSDIRGFTTMSEKMTAQENFDFVNEYLKLVSPIIQAHEGFVVKFLGDGMMAIFPYGVSDAVRAGIEKAEAVQAFNARLAERGLPSISVGIGIHTGPMMVGMIGEDLRMQGDAFSDNVNLTARLEGLNKFYGSSMIISEDTLSQMQQPVTVKLRSLGKAVVKGRANALGLYEVYEGLSAEMVAIRDATRADFERGIELYQAGKFADAGKQFNLVAERDPNDKAAKLYLESCAELLNRPLPQGWDGAIVMDAK